MHKAIAKNETERCSSSSIRNVATYTMLASQMRQSARIVFFTVTTATYLRCSMRASYLSTLTEVSVRIVAETKKAWVDLKTWRYSQFTFQMIRTINIGWTIKPTARSDNESPNSRIFVGLCKVGVLQIAPRTRKFPANAVSENTAFRAQTAS